MNGIRKIILLSERDFLGLRRYDKHRVVIPNEIINKTLLKDRDIIIDEAKN